MKKWMTAAMILALGVTLSATAFAAGHRGGQSGCGGHCGSGKYALCSFADENGDGVCDHAGRHSGFVDADGDGVCDHVKEPCADFCDADGDGVCDVCGKIPCHGTKQGTGKGRGCPRDTGHCRT